MKYKLIYGVVVSIAIMIAAWFPITNDESYYLQFALTPKLSYLDAPPFVAYLNLLQAKWGLFSPIFLRSWVLVLHLLSTMLLMHIVYRHERNSNFLSDKLLTTFLLAYLIPIFGLFGIFILPDTGLILSLSIMLWAADEVYCTKKIRWPQALVLGIGFGIGLLSKYHILPLGGGMLLGLWIALPEKINSFLRLLMSVVIGLVCALPVILWNVEYHFASIVFQFQHGFQSNHWHVKSALMFLLGSMVYVTPWFGVILLKRGLFTKPKAYLMIPVLSLFLILLLSSFRKNVLPHWISPAFWCLIPSTVIWSREVKSLLKLSGLTAIFWVLLLGALMMPGGLLTVKSWSKVIYPDTRLFKDLLLWQELPDLLHQHPKINQSLTMFFKEKQPPDCAHSKPIIGTSRWYFASQLEYHQMFKGATILNLDQNSSNFYLWRDDWTEFAHCRLLVLGSESGGVVRALANIMTIDTREVIHGLGDYLSYNFQVITGTLKDKETLQKAQNRLMENPHY